MTTPIPLDCLSLSAQELVAAHPPRWSHANKQLVYDISSPKGAAHHGVISYSRWAEMPLPVTTAPVDAGSASLQTRDGFYDYAPPAMATTPAVPWHVNFADASLFGFYGGSLFAQDEMQVAEHPALAALREALSARGLKALTEEGDAPTPVLVKGVERRCAIATDPNTAQGRPHGLYGNEFARAKPEAIQKATRRLDPPTLSNILAMAALRSGGSVYTEEEIEYTLATAYTAFRAAALESAPTTAVVHSGWWGCGAFGGNRTLKAALQIIDDETKGPSPLATAALIDHLAALRFRWGVSNNT